MDRYSRNKLVKIVGEEGQKKLCEASVLVLGVGGVGTHVVQGLASLGVGKIGIVDNDKISLSNLNRQVLYNVDSIGKYKVDVAKDWINKFNPDIDVTAYCVRLDEDNCAEIYKDYDILVDAFDSALSVDIINKTSVKYNKILIHAAVQDTQGMIMTTIPQKTPCFRCFFPNNTNSTEYSQNNIQGTIEPTVSLVANMQVYEVMKIILNNKYINTVNPLIIEGISGKSLKPKVYFSKKDKCPVCGLPLCSFKPLD